MATLIFNLKPLLVELKNTNISGMLKNSPNESRILNDWNSLIRELNNVSGKISRGEKLGYELTTLKNLAGSLSKSAAEIGSIVPGPIGIACSVALAIGCLIPPMDLVGLVLNLMGCIPFAKAGTKAFKPIIENIIRDILKNPAIKSTLKSGAGFTKKTIKYNEEYAKQMYRKMFAQSSQPFSMSPTRTPKTNVGFYYKTGAMPSLEGSILMNSKKSGMIKNGIPSTLYPSSSKMEYILRTKTGQYDPYSHLFKSVLVISL